MIIFIMENVVKHFKKLKLIAKILDTYGQFWPMSADILANFSFSYLVTLLQMMNILQYSIELQQCHIILQKFE